MSNHSKYVTKQTDMLFGLYDKPPLGQSVNAAFQHVLACFIGLVNGTLIIGFALDLLDELPYLISMALFASGISTFIQAKKIGPIGSGLIAVQGTSFAFVSALLTAGTLVRSQGGSNQDILALMFGVCFFGAFVEIFLSFFIVYLKRIITPLTTGIVITTIGLSLIQYGMTDLAGGFGAEDFGSAQHFLLGGIVLGSVVVLNNHHNPYIRLSAILCAMVLGCIIAYSIGLMSFSGVAELPLFSYPQPFKYGFSFDWQLFLPIALIYFLTAVETAGDLTANCLFCNIPLRSKEYYERIQGGVLADGVNSMIAAVFCSFPNTTFGQNNAVIQLTGVASRYVGFFIAGILILLSFFPVIGGVFQAMPKAIIGGATLVMFATVAVAGIKILASEPIDHRKTLIIATSFGFGLGVMMVPEALVALPDSLRNIVSSPITVAGFTAILLSIVLPEKTHEPSNQHE